MLKKQQAKIILVEVLRLNHTRIPMKVVYQATIKFDYGWLFYYQSKKFLKTKNRMHLVGGLPPILVDKFTGKTRYTNTFQSESKIIEYYTKYRENNTMLEKVFGVALDIDPNQIIEKKGKKWWQIWKGC